MTSNVDPIPTADACLTASVGYTSALANALSIHADHVHRIDALSEHPQYVRFFGAAATLAIPVSLPHQVVVAALVDRPRQRSMHLDVAGVYTWPQQQSETLRAIERLIQAYPDQWNPSRQLWSAKAEKLLPSEVY